MQQRVFCVLIAFLLFVYPLSILGEETEPTSDIHYSQPEDALSPAGELAIERIRRSIEGVRKRAGRSSFSGYCGKYVNNMLVYYGINTRYIGGDGNDAFNNYAYAKGTSGGYRIEIYSRRYYTLQEALETLSRRSCISRNILVGFSRGRSSKGRKFGHAVYIDSIIDGKIYFSESYDVEIQEDVIIPEGTVFVWDIDTFCEYYAVCKLDGLIHFLDPPAPAPVFKALPKHPRPALAVQLPVKGINTLTVTEQTR